MRYKAMLEARWKDAPVRIVDWTPEQQREFIIKDNVASGEWDWDALANDWDSELLDNWGLDLPAAFGDDEVEEDEAPEVSSEPAVSQLGEVYQLGRHRLMCGDSTNADNVARLLNGKEPYLMVTDPPYGVEYDPNWRKEHNATKGFASKTVQTGIVENGNNADWTAAYALAPSKVAYVWHSGLHGGTVAKGLTDSKFNLRAQIIWNKQYGVLGRGDYHWQHEPCWYAVKQGSKGNWAGDRKQTTVWDIKGFNPNGNNLQSTESKTGHGTQKPVECMARPLANHDGDVYDPFLGSGTTIIAAEQLGRTCYGLELSPAYCDVIRKRYAKFIGQEDWETATHPIYATEFSD